ncbi:MAG: hypothetical protein AB8B62_18235 [Roseobacter sp.]
MTRRTGIVGLALLALMVIAGLWMRTSQSSAVPNLQQTVAQAIEDTLQQEVVVTFDFEQNVDAWGFVCGTVAKPDGTAIATGGSALESSDFCALLDFSGTPNVRELDIGSTDMPAVDWMETHDLPKALFNED